MTTVEDELIGGWRWFIILGARRLIVISFCPFFATLMILLLLPLERDGCTTFKDTYLRVLNNKNRGSEDPCLVLLILFAINRPN